MMNKLDINLLALARQAGNDQTGLPGFYAVTPPHRTARGRSEDYLIILLSCTGGAPFPTNLQNQWFEEMSKAYYRTPGSTTAALRAAALALNQQLFDRALRGAGSRQGLGLLSLAVVRGGQIFLAHCGPQHAFVISPDRFEHFSDLENAGSGLGVARTIAIRFFQAPLQANDYVLITHQLPAGWEDAVVQSSHGQGLEAVRRSLLTAAGAEASAILIQAQAGHGHMRFLKPKPAPPSPVKEPPVSAPVEAPTKAGVLLTPPPAPPREAQPAITEPESALPAAAAGEETPPAPSLTPGEPPTSAAEQEAASAKITSEAAVPAPVRPTTAGQLSTGPKLTSKPAAGPSSTATALSSPAAAAGARRLNDRAPSKPIRARKSVLSSLAAPFRKIVSGTGKVAGRAGRAVGGGLRQAIKRILPDEGLFHLPRSTMIFFAVAVPTIIAIVGGMIYLERGRSIQYQSYYNQAFDLAVQAEKLKDPAQQRAAWGLVLIDLTGADAYRKTAESKDLRSKAQAALDQIEHIDRIDLQSAIRGGLDKSVQISRIVATNEELYLLNTARSYVIRALYTNKGYEVDPNFRCGKGNYGTIVVGPPVGLVSLPRGNTNNADVLGLDENGNRLYCGSASNLPIAKRIALPPEWQKPSAITLNPDNMNLYVLDVPANQVWIYQNVDKSEALLPFFKQEEQRNLADVIDIAAASGDLFLLHADGQVSRCTYGELSTIPARCIPLTFGGLPGGRPNGTTIDGTQLWQILYAPPPDPSLYLLDASNQAILHFSLLGTFQNQYRSQSTLPSLPAVALGISPRRTVFMAVGSQVYYTNLP